jgi:superoxide reductase
VKLNKSGKIFAISYCNIHGLWENSVDIIVE